MKSMKFLRVFVSCVLALVLFCLAFGLMYFQKAYPVAFDCSMLGLAFLAVSFVIFKLLFVEKRGNS